MAKTVWRLLAAMTMMLATAPWALADEIDGRNIPVPPPGTPLGEEKIPSNRELWQLLQQQQGVIDQQQAEITQLRGQLEATGEAFDSLQVARGASESGSSWADRTTVGGYGELHYNNLENRRSSGDDKEMIDFHRFVLFFDHEFNDSIRFFSELEVEHVLVGDGKPGEVELEQAYLEFDLLEDTTARAGLFLIPVGILNETHEPPTFYGVERNPIESNIIPSTWWEGGAMLSGRFDRGFSADLALTSGLKTDGFSIRGGRQKVAKADASDGAVTGRVVWRGFPGLELAASGQWQWDINSMGERTPASLFETHLVYNHGPFGLRALYARWDLFSDKSEIGGKNEQYGFYVEPSVRISENFGVFGRFNQWDNGAGKDTTMSNRYRQWDVGVNFWPHPDVVMKFDYQNQSAPDGEDEFDGINLGIGYQF
ncbi:MAG: porin [Myxococcota bacterium]